MSGLYTLEELEKRIGYRFHDSQLLLQALTHSSFTNEQRINRIGDYERLEFLGDAVLELVTSDFLFALEPMLPEGRMTKLRSCYVCEPALAYCAKDLELGAFIRLGKGEENSGGRGRESIVADVMEAIIGAIYLDSGIDDARAFILRFILSDAEKKQLFLDSKTILQEMVQKKDHILVTYKTVEERGPEHQKEFVVNAYIADECVSSGVGKSKKAAEQQAAYHAILKLKKQTN